MLGKINEAGEVRVNNKNVVIRPDKTFYAFCTLSEDTNTIKVQAKDVAGNINKPVYYTLKKKITNFIDTNFIDSQYKVEDFLLLIMHKYFWMKYILNLHFYLSIQNYN